MLTKSEANVLVVNKDTIKTVTKLAKVKKLLGVKLNEETKWVVITPDMAKWILDNCNVKNRPIRKNHLSDLVRVIKAGEWKRVGTGISFDSEGNLTDGQHRLTACVIAKKPIEVLLVFSIEHSTAIDTGAKRSFSDNIAIGDDCDNRLKEDKMLHKVFLTAYNCRLGYQSQCTLTPDEQVRKMNCYVDELIACKNAGLFNNTNTKGCDATIIKSALFLAYLNGVSIDILLNIVSVLRSGITTNAKEDAPIIGLRDKLLPLIGGGRETNQLRLAYTQHCIYKCTKGSSSKALKADKIYYTYDFSRRK